jgi:prepilin-type N-terminal cleavage/methylation domain-containing protein
MKNKNKNSGFTLIELLVVISVIGLMSAVIMVSLNSVRAKARDARRVQNVDAIATGVEIYFASNGFMPLGTNNIAMVDLAPQWAQLGALIGIARMPRDSTGFTSFYWYAASGSGSTALQLSGTSYCMYLPSHSFGVSVPLESAEYISRDLGMAPDSFYYVKGGGDAFIFNMNDPGVPPCNFSNP